MIGVGHQACSLDEGDTCNVTATATVVYEAGADDASGGSSARGVDSVSRKENLQKIATSAGVEGSDVSQHTRIGCRWPVAAAAAVVFGLEQLALHLFWCAQEYLGVLLLVFSLRGMNQYRKPCASGCLVSCLL